MRLSIILLLAGLVRAQSNEKYFSHMEKAIKGGGIAAAEGHLQVDVVARSPEWARRICAAAATSDLAMGMRAKDALRSAAKKIREIGERCAHLYDENADSLSARIDGSYFYLRVQSALGSKTTTEDWLGVAVVVPAR